MGCGDIASLPDEVLAPSRRADGRRPGMDVRRRAATRSTTAGSAPRRAGRATSRSAPMTTYRVGGSAALFVDVAGAGRSRAPSPRCVAVTGVPVLVVGRGSNMLVADAGFDGVAISIAASRAGSRCRTAHRARSGAPCSSPPGAAVSLPVLARRTAAAAITGFEWAVGVPGSIGGAVRMNAGGHGSDMAALRRRRRRVRLGRVDGEDAAGSRRSPSSSSACDSAASALAPLAVVVSARLRLAVGEREASEREIAEIVRWRREHQPGGQNCGSVFVNPVPDEVAAGEPHRLARPARVPDRHGVGLGQARQLHPGVRRRPRRRRARRDRGGAGTCRRGDRIPAAQRGSPGGVRRRRSDVVR